ncbi:MAG: NAD(P)/FAD-dependent oxidoreductase [Hahellaceae bacterium]|nr:NAD(P)/FAD-dependent oxidoreductase [Hahellaceae bacterium]
MWQTLPSQLHHFRPGVACTPFVPEISGAKSFAGPAFHTTNWQHEINFHGKRVALVGTGATAVQAIPEVARIAKELMVFQRTPIWVLPKNDRTYSDTEKEGFRTDPTRARSYRQDLWQKWEDFAIEAVRPTKHNVAAQKAIEQTITEVVKDPVTARALTPEYRFGCKRPTISNEYYQTFNRDNVTLVTSPIESIDAAGLLTRNGKHFEADILVYATGFQALGYPYRGDCYRT